MNDEPDWGLIMPFVTVASVGGPHDDDSYVAGYEMGCLDAILQQNRPRTLAQTIRSDSLLQADLLAMRYGYALTSEGSGVEGWILISLALLD